MLYVVATPIGNLEDLTLRAVRVLGEVDAVVAEDTRRTRGLLSHLNLSKPLLSLPAFDERARLGPLVDRLVRGENLALVTDAGTPGVSDPGALLVEAAWDAGVTVVPLPGPSAAIAAVSACGLDAARFFFAGFLPRKGKAREEALAEWAGLRAAIVLFEAGNRTGETLAELATRLGPRRALVARELTKLHEELARGPLDVLAERFREGARGEVVIVVEGAKEAPPAAEKPPIDGVIRARLGAGERAKELSHALAIEYELPRQEVYARILAVKSEGSEEA